MRRKFFPPEGGDALNRLPKEAVDAPSLQAFKARLDVALGSLALNACRDGASTASLGNLFGASPPSVQIVHVKKKAQRKLHSHYC